MHLMFYKQSATSPKSPSSSIENALFVGAPGDCASVKCLYFIYVSPDAHAFLWCEIEFPVGHIEETVPVVEECHDDIDAVFGD